jgi:uncharacterized protein
VRNEQFEWDDEKAALNLEKHGVSFARTIEIFDDPLAVTIDDPDHSDGEGRFITVGSTFWDEVLVAVHIYRDERIRIISTRRASHAERRRYMNEKFDRIHDKAKEEEMRPEYDFSGGVRGKFYQGRGRIVVHVSLDEDVARRFRTTAEVNEALRQLIAEGRAPEERHE